MPRTSQSKSKKTLAALTGRQLGKIWSSLSPAPLTDRLRQAQPAGRWSVSGHRITGCCPYHDDSTPSFVIYLDRGYAKCFGCGQFVWNPVDLWSQIKGVSSTDALSDLKQTFGITTVSQQAINQLNAWERHQAMKKRIVEICHNTMIDAVASPDKAHPAVRAAVSWLVEERKLPLSALPTLGMLGVMPPVAHILDALDRDAAVANANEEALAMRLGRKPDKVKPFTEDAKEYLSVANKWVGGVVFRYDTGPDTVGRIKIRLPQSHDFTVVPDNQDQDMGFFGVGWSRYKGLLGNQSAGGAVHVVEGEFDALTLMAHQVEQYGGPKMIVVGTGGAGSASAIDTLIQSAGAEEVFLVSDAPMKNGDPLLEAWLTNARELRARVFIGWPSLPGSGDPDEAVLQHGIDKVVSTLLDLRNRQCFVTPQDWVYSKAEPELEDVEEGDARRLVEIASNWGRLLKNQTECDAFVEACYKNYEVPVSGLKRQIISMEESEPAFIARLADVLSQEFFVIGQKATDADRKLVLWHKQKEDIIQVGLADDAAIEREMASALGPAYEFFTDRVSVPAFMDVYIDKESGPYLQKFDAACRWYYKQALVLLAQKAPDFHTSVTKSQGLHAIKNTKNGVPTLYLVNGQALYHGQYIGGVDPSCLKWSKLPGPRHDGILFDVGFNGVREGPWLESVENENDLARATAIDPGELLTRIEKVLDVGWRFKHHPITVKFMAAHIMAASVGDAYRRKAAVAVNAESSSGKSKLLMGLLGGTGTPELHILSAALGIGNYTAASIRQGIGNKSRVLALDEFEDEGNNERRSKIVAEVLDMLRDLTSEKPIIMQGSRSGEPIRKTMSAFVFTAAIVQARKIQDANRFVTVQLQHIDGRDDPRNVIFREFGSDFIGKIKRDLDVALFPHIANIQKLYTEIDRQYSTAASRPIGVETRYLEGLLPAMSIMKLTGRDHHKFLVDFCDAYRETMTLNKTHSESGELFNTLVQSPQLVVRDPNTKELNHHSFLQLLASEANKKIINSLGSGLYYDQAQGLLVVNWTQALQTVLSKTTKYRNETNVYSIRELANRHPKALKSEELMQSGAILRLRKCGVPAMTPHSLSAFRVDDWIKELNQENNIDEDRDLPEAPNGKPDEYLDGF